MTEQPAEAPLEPGVPPGVQDALDELAMGVGGLLATMLPPLERARSVAVRLEQENAQAVQVIENLLRHSGLTTTSWAQDNDAVDAARAWLQANA